MRVYWFAAGLFALLGCVVIRVPSESPSVQLAASVPPASSPEADHLGQAAECLERGDRAGAAGHLEEYVCRHPEQIMFRVQLAELLIRVGHDSTAKAHYERFVADAQSASGPPRGYLVTAHTRLMEIAQRTDDRFGELFHRGVGLLWLAKEQAKLADADPGFGEEMLCKAMKALVEARDLRPSDARARVYLAEVYDRLGSPRAADAERAAARRGVAPGGLTVSERRNCIILEQPGG